MSADILTNIPPQLRIAAIGMGVVIIVVVLLSRRTRSAARVLSICITLGVVAVIGVGPYLAEQGLIPGGAAAANPDAVDMDTPGPEGGPDCLADPRYFDEPAVGLPSDVAEAWSEVVVAAQVDGVIVCLNDGKRSRDQQQAQFDEYAEEYGVDVANDLVLPPNRSAHVIGTAVDVQPADAHQWLEATDGAFGFCRTYDNEPWHFEYDATYGKTGCPPRLPKPIP